MPGKSNGSLKKISDINHQIPTRKSGSHLPFENLSEGLFYLMPSRTHTTEEIVSYLLGAMHEAEADSLERAYFEDSALSVTVTQIETDLIDDYVRGQLPSRQRKQFEQHYLQHPNHRRRVEDAKVLLFKLDQLKKLHPATAEKGSWGRFFPLFTPGRVLPYATATLALLLTLGGLRLWSQNSQLHQQITALQITRSENAQRIRDLAQQVATEHQSKDQPAGRVGQPRPQPSASPAHSTARSNIPALTLAIGAMRRGRGERESEEVSSQLQRITSGNKAIRLILKMRETAYQTYRAEIWTDAGPSEKIFSTSNKISLKRQAGVETVEVLVPADLFKKGISSYRVHLTGIAPSGQERSISPAFFRVEKR